MKLSSIHYIKELAKKTINSELKKLGTAQTKTAIEGVMHTVGLSSKEEAILFCAYFDKTCQGRSMDFEDVSHYFGCPTLDIMEMVPSVKSLLSKGYIVRARGLVDDSLANITRMNLVVEDSVFSAILGNAPVIPKPAKDWETIKLDRYEFCGAVGKLVEDKDIDTDQLVNQVLRLEDANLHHSFVNNLRTSIPDVTDRVLFYDLAYDHYRSEGNKRSDIVQTLRDIHSNFSKYMLSKKDILEGNHILETEGLIEKFNDKEMRLTQKGCALFFAEDMKYFVKNRKCEDIYAFLAMVSDFMHDENQYRSQNDHEQLPKLLDDMENENNHIAQLQEIDRVLPEANDRAMLYVLGADLVNGICTTLSSMVKMFRGDMKLKMAANQFRLKKSLIQIRGYAELQKMSGMMGDQMMIKLTERGMEVLLGEDAEMDFEEVDDKRLISPDDIVAKKTLLSKRNRRANFVSS